MTMTILLVSLLALIVLLVGGLLMWASRSARTPWLAVVVVLAALGLLGCPADPPTGPIINNSGDGNSFNCIGNTAGEDGQPCTTPPPPAPIVPVVVTPPAPPVI